jgi:hypothetical protein
MKVRLVLATAFFAALSLSAPVPSSAAVVGCNFAIYNQGGLLNARQSELKALAQKLNSIGVDVRVINLLSYDPYPTLASYMKSRQKACRSWQSATGSWKPNLLVIVATIKERKIQIYYAPKSKLATAFRKGGGTARIAKDFIYPKIYQARWPAGYLAGMNESYRVINSYLHP